MLNLSNKSLAKNNQSLYPKPSSNQTKNVFLVELVSIKLLQTIIFLILYPKNPSHPILSQTKNKPLTHLGWVKKEFPRLVKEGGRGKIGSRLPV